MFLKPRNICSLINFERLLLNCFVCAVDQCLRLKLCWSSLFSILGFYGIYKSHNPISAVVVHISIDLLGFLSFYPMELYRNVYIK